jgi:hypothetical protein
MSSDSSPVLKNPFTPSEIASSPDSFFGRNAELRQLERSLEKSSVAIHGPIGIGKSSLLARGLMLMDGFGTDHECRTVTVVGHKDVTNVDDAARLFVEQLVTVDEKTTSMKLKLGSLAEFGSAETVQYFKQGGHLSVLRKIVEKGTLKLLLDDGEYLLLAVDEADKCPVPLTRLVRALLTHAQQQGVSNVRFVLAGVSPFFQEMVEEDPGVARFFRRTITLEPMTMSDAEELLTTKLSELIEHAEGDGHRLEIAPSLVGRILALSGGHPHLIQLLGSHVVENENDDPDGILDERDLAHSLTRIVYEDRAQAYDSTIHMLELEGRLDDVRTLMGDMRPGLPSMISADKAKHAVGRDALHWLVERDILREPDSRGFYGLVDEFLRIRLLMDDDAVDAVAVEEELIMSQWLSSIHVPRREREEAEYDFPD